MFHVWDGWRSGMSIFSIPLSWYKSMTKFVNNLAAGRGIEIEKPDNPSMEAPVKIKVCEEVWESLDALTKTKAPKSIDEIKSGYESTAVPGSKDSAQMTAGAVNQAGFSLKVLCRAASDGATVILHFRELIITSDGRIQQVKGEQEAVSVYPGE